MVESIQKTGVEPNVVSAKPGGFVPVANDDPSTDGNLSVLNLTQPNGTYFNTARFNLWHKLGESTVINGGVYRSGDPGIAATPYASIRYNFISSDKPLLSYRLGGALGVFSILPHHNIQDRYVIGTIPSFQVFIGSEQDLFCGVKIREALELEPLLYVGYHYPVDFVIPLSIGLSIGKDFGDDFGFSIGSKIQFFLENYDAQDVYSVMPVYENATLFLLGETPIVDVGFATEFHNDEIVLKGLLSKGIDLGGGELVFSLAGAMSVQGDFPAYPPYALLELGYNLADNEEKKGLSAQYIVDAPFNQINFNGEFKDNHYLNKFAENLSDIYAEDLDGQEISCDFISGSVGYSCTAVDDVPIEKLWCKRQGDEFVCTDEGANMIDKSWGVTYTLQCESENGYYSDNMTCYVEGMPEVKSDDPIKQAFFDYEDLNSFVSSLEESSEEDKLSALAFLSYLAYTTYNDDDLITLSKKVNQVNHDEIYKNSRNYLIDRKNSKKTTVCRGFSKYIAHIAKQWGFKSNVVRIAEQELHTITMLKTKGSGYAFIDGGGDGFYKTGFKSVLEALQEYCIASNRPIQTKFVIYGSDGKYQKTIFTNEGKMLMESTTFPSKIDEFLQYE